MVRRSVQPLANSEQLELMQQLGRIRLLGIRPRQRQRLHAAAAVAAFAGVDARRTSSHSAPLLHCELMSDAERHRFGNALEQAVSRRLNLNLELQLMNLYGDHGDDSRQGAADRT